MLTPTSSQNMLNGHRYGKPHTHKARCYMGTSGTSDGPPRIQCGETSETTTTTALTPTKDFIMGCESNLTGKDQAPFTFNILYCLRGRCSSSKPRWLAYTPHKTWGGAMETRPTQFDSMCLTDGTRFPCLSCIVTCRKDLLEG